MCRGWEPNGAPFEDKFCICLIGLASGDPRLLLAKVFGNLMGKIQAKR